MWAFMLTMGKMEFPPIRIRKTTRQADFKGRSKPFISRCQANFQVNIASKQLTKQAWNFWERSKLETQIDNSLT